MDPKTRSMSNGESKYGTDYLGVHKKVYERKRADGEPGWSDPSTVNRMRRIVRDGLERQGISGGRLLELGCGDGSLSIALAADGFEAFGVDVVPMAVSWARDKASAAGTRASFQVGNAFELPYSDRAFDLVIDALCSHCIIGGDRSGFFGEAFRILRRGGLLVAVCMCGEPPEELKEYFDYDSRCLVRNGIAGRYIGLPEDIIGEAERAGFRALDWWTQTDEEQQEELVLYGTR
ncbi:methyltransferase domain-containing protein [Candidatus Fermentibacteria bacterium]|nr:methyltransferase domain-containing protein [Candidatus Fermentibacteria bacterium]